jgi:hypothetical protein
MRSTFMPSAEKGKAKSESGASSATIIQADSRQLEAQLVANSATPTCTIFINA